MAAQKNLTVEENYNRIMALLNAGKEAEAMEEAKRQKENEYLTKCHQLVELIQKGNIKEAVEEAKLWEATKIKEIKAINEKGNWPDLGKIFWKLGQYCESQENFSTALNFYEHVAISSSYERQSFKQMWQITEWHRYLFNTGEMRFSHLEEFNNRELSFTGVIVNDDFNDHAQFIDEAYVVTEENGAKIVKPNPNKSLDDIRTMLGFPAKPKSSTDDVTAVARSSYTSPLSNEPTSSPTTTTTTTTTATIPQNKSS